MKNTKRAQALLAAEPDGWMETLGARIAEAEPGRVVLELEAGPQHRHGGGVVQGGVITQIADAAMGMSLGTLQEYGMWNTTIELKINYLRPFKEGHLKAIAKTVHRGRTVGMLDCDVIDDRSKVIARSSSTCLTLRGEQTKGRNF